MIHKIGEEYAAIRDMEIQTEKEENYKKVTLDKEIKVEDMTFHYPDTEDAVLAHVNVTIPKNKSVAFIGPSGAGKTTMVDLILGVLKPQAGKITVDGMDIKESYRGCMIRSVISHRLSTCWTIQSAIILRLVR